MNLRAISVDYVIVDTLREPRETFAAILETIPPASCEAARSGRSPHKAFLKRVAGYCNKLLYWLP